ncbi:MAG: GAF domain-containing protein [bacterium]|nr:GAF domain-containing protein [bacterium]
MQLNKIDLLLDIIKKLNDNTYKIDTIKQIIDLIKSYTNIEAVGIRLQSGEDFPYYTTTGFPEKFVEAERFLCGKDRNGEIIRDSEGTAVLECMCGNIIRGGTDPQLPFFTANGSFWSNCTTELLAATTEEDRQGKTRNRCNGEGYESVACIPLRNGEETIGLLQLNDTGKNVFTEEIILFFESLGESFGVALTKREHEEELQMLNNNLENLVKQRTRELSKALDAKGLLLQEIHHRVKNNLQTISALLEMQSMEYKDEIISNALHDACTRVKSMGMIHNKLYESGDPGTVTINEFCRALANEIAVTNKLESKNIIIEITGNEVQMNRETAVPFALIFFELINNSIKHAFTDPAGGLISVVINREEAEYSVDIRDNGKGFPDNFDIEANMHLGLEIVINFIKQLSGTFQYGNDNGAWFHFLFERDNKEELRWNH